MIPCLHFGLRPASGRFTIEPKLASWVESGYKSPESPGPRQRGRRRDGLSRRRRGRFRSTAPYPAATNSRGVSKPRARRDNGLTFNVSGGATLSFSGTVDAPGEGRDHRQRRRRGTGSRADQPRPHRLGWRQPHDQRRRGQSVRGPQRLHGRGRGGARSAQAASLTQAAVGPVLHQAISAWVAAGLDPKVAAQLEGVVVQITPLPAPTWAWPARASSGSTRRPRAMAGSSPPHRTPRPAYPRAKSTC